MLKSEHKFNGEIRAAEISLVDDFLWINYLPADIVTITEKTAKCKEDNSSKMVVFFLCGCTSSFLKILQLLDQW